MAKRSTLYGDVDVTPHPTTDALVTVLAHLTHTAAVRGMEPSVRAEGSGAVRYEPLVTDKAPAAARRRSTTYVSP